MTRKMLMAAVFSAAGLGVASAAQPGDPDFDPNDPALQHYIVGDKMSGYVYAEPETRAMQDDDFQNPAMLWLEQGEELWATPMGAAGKSCADCHGDAEESMKGVGATYPKYAPELGKLENVEQRIIRCREQEMNAYEVASGDTLSGIAQRFGTTVAALQEENGLDGDGIMAGQRLVIPAEAAGTFKWESDELLGLTAWVKYQSRGMPVNVAIDGPAKPFFEKGKEFYYTRRGHFDLACKHCHIDNNGQHIRAELLSQGMPNGFPLYRLKWQKLGSLHRRFRGCNKNIRAEPYPFGSDEYVNLELYTMWRAQGLPIEAPAVRK